MASITTAGLIWDEAAQSSAIEFACRFESAWKQSAPGQRPDPLDFLGPIERSRPALLLALLRVDLAHRQRAGEEIPIESYRDRHAEIRGDALVALVYEDYCLREEAGEFPDPGESLFRFPEIADRLREVLEIHDLVAEPGSTAADSVNQAIPFPEVGQTIAGFHLVEELGRGSFARVFLAQERQLGDRPVALKVSRTGSREPQTLARLQHTHIVPVHSYRIDPATGLHLLCMPFFGRVTLARLLAESSPGKSRSGADLTNVLDRIGAKGSANSPQTPARAILASLSYPRAIAWWGARMAEGLQHAHDRGVLHRDVKPSNVLIAGDGMPMLLDFNLARESDFEKVPTAKLGGTLAYMAPEHLDALGEEHDRTIDHRADIYSLGMVLLEALGVKPMTGPSEATTLADSLTWLLENRRREAPLPAESPLEIPEALEAVVRYCLAPDPDDRYSSAANLAVDLQAIADDASLHFAAEPWPPRACRWLRNHRLRLAVAGPLVVAILALVVLLFRSQAESVRQESSARELIHDGIRSAELGEFQAASAQFARASVLLRDRTDLAGLLDEANHRQGDADAARRIRDLADDLFRKAEPLRFALLGFEGDRLEASRKLAEALRPFDVGGSTNWVDRPELTHLDQARKTRLVREVDDLLFFSVIALALETRDRSRASRNALDYCDKALRFTDRPGPWQALRDWWIDPTRGRPSLPVDLTSESFAAACFRWYLLGKLALVPDLSTAWLERATRLEPENYWHQFALAFERDKEGRPDLALPSCNAAVALRPGSPRARKVRARIFQKQGRWASVLEDLEEALAVCTSTDEKSRLRLDRGIVRQRLGDFPGARRDYDAVILARGERWMARDARRNLARLEADRGFDRVALARYDALVASDQGDFLSRRGRVRLQLRRRRPDSAEADLTFLIASASPVDRATYLAERAVARLAMDRPIEAEADALTAFRMEPTTANARLIDRARLASQIDLESWPDDPNAFDAWPDGGPTLGADLRSAALRLESKASQPDDPGIEARLTRAVLLSAARAHEEAIEEAGRLVSYDPRSARFRRLRASIFERAGKLNQAMKDVACGLGMAPEDADLFELRGKIRVHLGDFDGGLVDLRIAAERGATSSVGPAMAEALTTLNRHEEALGVWSKLVLDESLEPRNWLGLAKARRLLGDWDAALIALEESAGLVDDQSPLLVRMTEEYAACLPSRPGCWPRLIDLGRRMVAGATRGK
jgi:eukaryotic-like serine/threonine-protein kinase